MPEVPAQTASATTASICLVMHSFGGGGEKMALLLARELASLGWSVHVACLRALPALRDHMPDKVSLAMPKGPGLADRLRFLPVLLKLTRSCQVVLGTLELQSLLAAALVAPGRATGWLHKDLAAYLEDRPFWYVRLYRALCRLAFARCRTVVCVSDGILASCQRLWPDLKDRFQRIYNGLDLDEIHRLAQAPLPAGVADFFSHEQVVLGVGRLEPQKNFGLLLEAVALLRDRGLQVRLCLAGEGSQRSLLEAQVQALGLAGQVLLPGFVNPCPLMRRARALALTSRFEGFALVLAEALALGLPVVSVNCPSGPAEVLDQGRCGLLVQASASALADGLQEVLAQRPDAGAQARMAARAAEFDLERILPQWIRTLSDGLH